MLICNLHECHTTAGCAHRGPEGQLCYWPGESMGQYDKIPGWLHEKKALSEFSDDEIAREYHWRMMQKLGDPRIGVSGKAAR